MDNHGNGIDYIDYVKPYDQRNKENERYTVEHHDEVMRKYGRTVEPEVLEFLAELEKAQCELSLIIKPMDLVHVYNNYRCKPSCYEVKKTDSDGVEVIGDVYAFSWIDILAVFRYDGTDYTCIWRKGQCNPK